MPVVQRLRTPSSCRPLTRNSATAALYGNATIFGTISATISGWVMSLALVLSMRALMSVLTEPGSIARIFHATCLVVFATPIIANSVMVYPAYALRTRTPDNDPPLHPLILPCLQTVTMAERLFMQCSVGKKFCHSKSLISSIAGSHSAPGHVRKIPWLVDKTPCWRGRLDTPHDSAICTFQIAEFDHGPIISQAWIHVLARRISPGSGNSRSLSVRSFATTPTCKRSVTGIKQAASMKKTVDSSLSH